jgi:putative ABC transport system substrate-binding protein
MTNTRFQLVPIISCLIVGILGCGQIERPAPTAAGKKKIAMIVPVAHPSLEQAVSGFRRGLAEKGLDESRVFLDERRGNGDFSRVPSLVKAAMDDGAVLVFVLTTPAAADAVKLTNARGVPLVYTAVTDPVAAGIVTAMDKSTTLATGVSDRYPVEEQVSLFFSLQPRMKSAGFLFNPAEENSRILVAETATALQAHGVASRRYEVGDAAAIASRAKLALAENDCLIVNGDNLVTENLSAVVNLCVRERKPLFVGDPDSVRKGAVATVGPSYFDLGVRSGHKAAAILAGTTAGSIPSEYPETFDYIVNIQAAGAMGLEVPASFWGQRAIWESRLGAAP